MYFSFYKETTSLKRSSYTCNGWSLVGLVGGHGQVPLYMYSVDSICYTCKVCYMYMYMYVSYMQLGSAVQYIMSIFTVSVRNNYFTEEISLTEDVVADYNRKRDRPMG